MKTSHRLGLFGAVFALLGSSALVLGPGALSILTSALIAAVFALSFNIAAGQAGMLSFGHAAFFGCGAFTAIHLLKMSPGPVNVLLYVPVAAAGVGLLLGLVFGWFATLRTGVYFAMMTLAFAEMLHTLAYTWSGVFGGEGGLTAMRPSFLGWSFGTEQHVFVYVLIWSGTAVFAAWSISRTRLGLLANALRDDEERVRFLGTEGRAAKTLVLGLSAGLSALAGALFAVANEAVGHSVMGIATSAAVVLGAYLGGTRLFLGPAVGAVLYSVGGRLLSDVTHLWQLYIGIAFVGAMLFMPRGILPSAIALWRARRTRPDSSLQLAEEKS